MMSWMLALQTAMLLLATLFVQTVPTGGLKEAVSHPTIQTCGALCSRLESMWMTKVTAASSIWQKTVQRGMVFGLEWSDCSSS